MVYLFAPIVIYLCLGIADGLRFLIANSSQDMPVLQLFIAFIWGLMWGPRLAMFSFKIVTNHNGEGMSHVE